MLDQKLFKNVSNCSHSMFTKKKYRLWRWIWRVWHHSIVGFTIMAERFVQTEQKNSVALARGFLSMTTWRCLGFWKCKNCRERAGVVHNPSMHTMNFPKQVMQVLPARSPSGSSGGPHRSVAADWPSFLYRLAWYFFFPPTSRLFLLHPWGHRINQVYIGGSGFFRHLAFPQHTAGKQNQC